jgi:hypothetical protein
LAIRFQQPYGRDILLPSLKEGLDLRSLVQSFPQSANEIAPPQDILALGYAADSFTKVDQLHKNTIAGTVLSFSPTDVALLFDGTTKASSGAAFNLFASDDGGTKITFVPINTIVVYGHTLAGSPRQFDTTSIETVNFGQATLIGVSGNGQVLCESCDFMKWGAWLTDLNVADHPDAVKRKLPNQIKVTASQEIDESAGGSILRAAQRN